MLNEILQKPDEVTRQEFIELLLAWSSVAHTNGKWERLAMLREIGETLGPTEKREGQT